MNGTSLIWSFSLFLSLPTNAFWKMLKTFSRHGFLNHGARKVQPNQTQMVKLYTEEEKDEEKTETKQKNVKNTMCYVTMITSNLIGNILPFFSAWADGFKWFCLIYSIVVVVVAVSFMVCHCLWVNVCGFINSMHAHIFIQIHVFLSLLLSFFSFWFRCEIKGLAEVDDCWLVYRVWSLVQWNIMDCLFVDNTLSRSHQIKLLTNI